MSSSKQVIVIPYRLALAEHVYSLRLDSLNLSETSVCEFDFRGCTYGEPFPLLLLANKIRLLSKRYRNCKFSLLAGKETFHTFADHIGFFRYIGWPRGREPGEAWGSTGYLPVERFSISEFQKRSLSGPVGKQVSAEADRLAVVLSQKDEGPLFDVIQYAIREIMRNAAEHSKGDYVTILGQYWPKREKAEIVVIDDGIGIPSTLYSNEYVECNDSREALKCALLPGISGVPLSERLKQDEYWGNSGFGLYVTSRVCADHGTFRIVSDHQGLTLRSGVQIEHDWKLNGTCVQMTLELRHADRIQNDIPRIIEDGEKQRLALLSEFPIKASAASKMLSSQYRKIILRQT